MFRTKSTALKFAVVCFVGMTALTASIAAKEVADEPANPTAVLAGPQRDGSHDFDFLIGDWKAHARRLPERLNNSDKWDVYDGISNHHKVFDTNASHWGHDWIVIPNPTYGSWESTAYKGDFNTYPDEMRVLNTVQEARDNGQEL